MKYVSLLIALFWMAVLGPTSASGQFLEGYELPGLNGEVRTFVVFDDGEGDKLYAAGEFTRGDGALMGSVAVWDGSRWSPVGPADPANAPSIVRLLAHDDGGGPELYAVGEFEEIGDGVAAQHVARWDGHTWSPVGAPVPFSRVLDATSYDDGGGTALFVSGVTPFTGVRRIWKLTGATWTAVLTERVDSMQVWDDGNGEKIFLTGDFSPSGVAHWDGTTLSVIPGLSGGPTDIFPCDLGDGERLYASGRFLVPGPPSVVEDAVASWDAVSGWRIEFSGFLPDTASTDEVTCYDVGAGTRLAVGGSPGFENGEFIPVDSAFSWDGTTLRQLDSAGADGLNGVPGALERSIYALQFFDDGSGPALYAGGAFRFDGVSATPRVARWRGSDWEGVDASGLQGAEVSTRLYALKSADLGDGTKLYAAGEVFAIGEVASNLVASFDGEEWQSLHDPAGPVIRTAFALEEFDWGEGPRLIVGGEIRRLDEPTIGRIAAWDGSAWLPLLEDSAILGFFDGVFALEVFDYGLGPRLFVGGQFEQVNGQVYNHIMEWDGVSFSPLLDRGFIGVGGKVLAMTVYDDGEGPDLYVGGEFATAGGEVGQYLARWDGASWTPVGLGLTNGPVKALATYDDGSGPALFIGGSFSNVGNLDANYVAKWDGTVFSTLPATAPGEMGAGLVGGSDPEVWALHVVDAGDGEKLYASGPFETTGDGAVSPGLAVWDGETWQAPKGATAGGFGNGLPPQALGSLDTGDGASLFVAGLFTTIYGLRSVGVGEYRNEVTIFADGFESGDLSAWGGAQQ